MDDALMSQSSDLTWAQFFHPGKDKDSDLQGYKASGTFSVPGRGSELANKHLSP